MSKTRFLGLDWGTKNIGLAISGGQSNTLAMPYEVVARNNATTSHLKHIVQTEHITALVVGKPVHLSGEGYNEEVVQDVRSLLEPLAKELDIELIFEDERLSSSAAQALGAGNEKIDDVAAQTILQSYLDRQKA